MTDNPPMSLTAKAALSTRIWATFVKLRFAVGRERLPELTTRLREIDGPRRPEVDARRLGRIVYRVLRIGPWRARCLVSALVLYRLLREQGEDPVLVIGMPPIPKDEEAHAWVEIDGIDVGPPPGSVGHEPLARFS